MFYMCYLDSSHGVCCNDFRKINLLILPQTANVSPKRRRGQLYANENLCNGTMAGFQSEDARPGIWDGMVVYKQGDYNKTILR